MQDIDRVDAWIAEADNAKRISAEKAAERAVKKIVRLIDGLGWDYQSVADDANRATQTTEWTAEIIEAAYKALKRKKMEAQKNRANKHSRQDDKGSSKPSAATTQQLMVDDFIDR